MASFIEHTGNRSPPYSSTEWPQVLNIKASYKSIFISSQVCRQQIDQSSDKNDSEMEEGDEMVARVYGGVILHLIKYPWRWALNQ